jgi:hypothetical protein
MAARSTTPKAPKPPKPWRREDGAYRSVDDRFTIEGGGAGRWFLTDAEALDELGLARTLGPYDTLDEAKAAADGQRGQGTQASPLAERLAAAKTKTAPAGRAKAGPKSTTSDEPDEADAPDEEDAPDEPDEAKPRPAPARRTPARKPPPRTWLDELGDDDPEAAARARRAIAALEHLGLDDADGVVRRDVLGRQPAIAARLLGRAVSAALRTRLEPGDMASAAKAAVPGPMKTLRDADEAALAAYAAFVAARVLEAVLEVVTGTDRAEGAGRDLPGWRLIERPAARDGADDMPRRLIVTPSDVSDR